MLGGNGIYCLAGMRLFEKDCSLIAAVGEDFDTYYGEWYDRNGLDRSANLVRDAHTMYSDLTYREDGSYTDVSVWGGDSVFHSRDLLLRDSDFLPYLGGLKGLYLYSRWDREFPSAHELQKQFGYKIMWEVTTGIDSSFRPEFDRYLERCDIYSLNYKESRAVFGTDDLGTLIREIKKIGKPCYYRLGRKGAVMIDGGTAAFVPMLSIDPDCEPDATGCGNASTAAAFWAWSEGYDPLTACCIGNTAAAFNVHQYGPCPDLSDTAMENAMRFAVETRDRLRPLPETYL